MTVVNSSFLSGKRKNLKPWRIFCCTVHCHSYCCHYLLNSCEQNLCCQERPACVKHWTSMSQEVYHPNGKRNGGEKHDLQRRTDLLIKRFRYMQILENQEKQLQAATCSVLLLILCIAVQEYFEKVWFFFFREWITITRWYIFGYKMHIWATKIVHDFVFNYLCKIN